MKQELEYFRIGESFGGNQDWFTNVVMHVGGCAAATACDSCIYFAREWGLSKLYPYNNRKLTKQDYLSFSMKMKPYIRPRVGGVSKLSWYIDGFGRYMKDAGVSDIRMEGFPGSQPYEAAEHFVIAQLSTNCPIPYLMLKHKKSKYKDFVWHWFLIVGCEKTEEDFFITVATYGAATTFSLRELWDTGYDEKGGLIRYIMS